MLRANQATLRAVLRGGLLVLSYFVVAKASLQFSDQHFISPVWPAAGIAVGALYLWGLQYWVALLIATIAINLNLNLGWAATLGVTLGNLGEGVLGAYLLRRYAARAPLLSNVRSLFLGLVAGGLLASFISALFGSLSSALSGDIPWTRLGYLSLTWWTADFVGILVVAPLLVAWGMPQKDRAKSSWWECVLLFAISILTSQLAWGGWPLSTITRFPFSFLIMPLLLWGSFRLGHRGRAALVVLLSLIAVVNTRLGYNVALLSLISGSLLILQAFIATSTITFLALSAILSERDRILFELRRSNVELERFAYLVSHDLQEPIRSVSNFAQLVGREYSDRLDDRANELIAFIRSTCVRMQLLISGLLDYSRVGRTINLHSVKAESALAKAMENLASSLQAAQAQVKVESLMTVRSDEILLCQLFQNLLSNALKFSRKGVRPEVTISAKLEEGMCVTCVADNGIGISPEYSEKIFQLFQRLHSEEEYNGSGIGLAVCHKIVELHGGRIWVESSGHGGSRFYFSLPLG